MKAKDYNEIFKKSIEKYHVLDDMNQPFDNPYNFKTEPLRHLLYQKCWIDTVQWHCEDIVRLPHIEPTKALALKRKIDASNQRRTNVVEYIDSYFLDKYKGVKIKKNATHNSESPAWAIDRLSILALKIYHMQQEVCRDSASETHQKKCQEKLDILLMQQKDLSQAIDQLLEDIAEGNKYMTVYKQMKMYNDKELNPILYNKNNFNTKNTSL